MFPSSLLVLDLVHRHGTLAAANHGTELVPSRTLGTFLFVHVVLLGDTFGRLKLSDSKPRLVLLSMKAKDLAFR